MFGYPGATLASCLLRLKEKERGRLATNCRLIPAIWGMVALRVPAGTWGLVVLRVPAVSHNGLYM